MPYADFVQCSLPWYSARGSDSLLAGRDFGMIATSRGTLRPCATA